MIHKHVFIAKGNPALAESATEAALNEWLEQNPGCRVINIETLMKASGGEGFLGSGPVALSFNGLRVWYETPS